MISQELDICREYCWPFREVVGNDPYISKCINVKISIDLLTPSHLVLVCLPFTFNKTSKFVKLRESRILSDINH